MKSGLKGERDSEMSNIIKMAIFSVLICILPIVSVSAERIVGDYVPVFEGIEYAAGSDTSLRLMKAFAMRIDLQNPHIQLYATPANGTLPEETIRQTTTTFLESHGLKAAVNANFYLTNGSYANCLGLVISDGVTVSSAASGTFSTQLRSTSDKVASLIASGITPTGIHTAVGGAEIFLSNGVNIGLNPDIFPRTGLGLSQDRRYLIWVVVDGRQTGYSEGCNQYEMAEWMLNFGAWDGANFDGGGSSCIVMDNGSGEATVLNSPSDGSPRSVGANLGVFSTALPFDHKQVYVSFEIGEGTFDQSLAYSGTTSGILSSSMADLTTESRYEGKYSQKLTILDDGGVSNGWLVRHVSGSSATRGQNILRPTKGYIGFWAKTSTPNVEISIAIDNTANVTADRGLFTPLVADGQWHLYEWNLEDDSQWQGWVNGDGVIDTIDFTIDSIQIRTDTDQDAVIYLDNIVHYNRGSIVYWDSVLGDFEPDGDVDLMDFSLFAGAWLSNELGPDWNRIYDLDDTLDGEINIDDLTCFVESWQMQLP